MRRVVNSSNRRCDGFSSGKCGFRSCHRPESQRGSTNDNSIGIIIEYGSFRLSLMGDAEPREWAHWLTHSSHLFPDVHVHKSSHHGSINGDTEDGVLRLSPEAVVISVGNGNSYGHLTCRLSSDQ
jgi:beta-lactamase superfamily II metal-dependent hydrolase